MCVCAVINIWFSDRYRFRGSNFSIKTNQINKRFFPVVLDIPELFEFSVSLPTVKLFLVDVEPVVVGTYF